MHKPSLFSFSPIPYIPRNNPLFTSIMTDASREIVVNNTPPYTPFKWQPFTSYHSWLSIRYRLFETFKENG